MGTAASTGRVDLLRPQVNLEPKRRAWVVLPYRNSNLARAVPLWHSPES